MSSIDPDAIVYLECAMDDLKIFGVRNWYFNDSRLDHEAQGIAFQIEDLLNKVRERLNKQADYE